MKTLTGDIARTRIELEHTKPRSRRRVELETRLVVLMAKQLRRETRADKRKAA